MSMRAGWSAARLLSAVTVLAACATPGTASGSVDGDSPCRFVTPAEVAKATGLPAVKPVEFQGGCSYLLNPSDVLPSIDPDATTFPPLPPAVEVHRYAADGIIGFGEPDPNMTPVPGLTGTALWHVEEDIDVHELEVELPTAALTINIMPPSPPQHLTSADLKSIAVQIYRDALPRLG